MTDAPLLSVAIPVPPSANRIWRTTRNGRTYKASSYTAWQEECWFLLRQAGCIAVGLRHYALRIVMPKTQTDLDNAIKPVGDMLQRFGVIEDDKRALRVTAERDLMRDADTALIELWPLAAPDEPKKKRKPRLTRATPQPSLVLR